MPCGLGELIQLQTLPLFLVGNESDSGEGKHKKRIGGESELKFFNNLRGQLEIEGLLNAKPFFPSLKRLTIYNMLSSTSNGWEMRDVAVQQAPSYPYLEHLYLSNITAELCLHFIYAFSSLKSLEISNVEDLISLSLGLQHLSTLQTLTINHSENLASLPYSIGCLTSLTLLQINFFPKLTSLPKEMRSDCLYIYKRCWKRIGVDWPQISHIPNIIIY